MGDFTFKRLSAKLVRRTGYHGTVENPIATFGHWCPACEKVHDFAVETPFPNGARWTFDGNVEAPTMSPSMNIGVGPFPNGRVERCHYFLRNGSIQFLGDCTHAMAGQTVPLPDLPAKATQWADEVP